MLSFEEQVEEVVKRALAEDVGDGDPTTDALIPKDLQGKAYFLVKEQGVVAGLPVAEKVFRTFDPRIRVEILIPDGSHVRPGDIAGRVTGSLSNILKAERTAINFLQHLSGIASAAARYVEAVKGLPVKILDTRKTLPGLRVLEKYAVKMGGGQNHRMNLGDGVLIKDNHLAVLYRQGLTMKDVVRKARGGVPKGLKIEIEVKNLEETRLAAEAGPDIILLDNMSVEMMREAVKIIKGRALIEASGGINLSNVRAIAETGVNFASSGSLTHSVKALDISLEFEGL